jgi:hypothetical protein
MRLLIYLVCFTAGLPTAAEAQNAQDFSALRVRVGDKVYVTDGTTGVEVSGPIETLTDTRLAINGYSFTPGTSLTIERRGDSIWDGAAVGFAVGALALYPVVPETFAPKGGGVRINNGLLWGAIGALIDYAHKGRTTVYKGSSHSFSGSARLLPQIEQRRKAVALAFAF